MYYINSHVDVYVLCFFLVFFYLSTPFSLCLCFLDISKPPPQAPYTRNNNIDTSEDANVCHGGLTDFF